MTKFQQGNRLGCATLLVAACGAAWTAYAQDEMGGANAGVLNPLSLIDPRTLDAFASKPLFSPTRTVPEEAEVQPLAVSVEEPPDLALRLIGITTTPAGSVARVIDENDGAGYSLRVGEVLQDWTVVAIDSARVNLEQDGQSLSLAIFSSSGSGSGSTTAVEPDPEQTEEQTEAQVSVPRKVRVIETTRKDAKERPQND